MSLILTNILKYTKKHVVCSYGYKLVCVAHRDCNINVKLNHKIPVFHNLKNYKMGWKSTWALVSVTS